MNQVIVPGYDLALVVGAAYGAHTGEFPVLVQGYTFGALWVRPENIGYTEESVLTVLGSD